MQESNLPFRCSYEVTLIIASMLAPTVGFEPTYHALTVRRYYLSATLEYVGPSVAQPPLLTAPAVHGTLSCTKDYRAGRI